MQVPINFEVFLDMARKQRVGLNYDDDPSDSTYSDFRLSLESQRQMKSLRMYMDRCRSALREIHTDLLHFEMDSGNQSLLSSILKRLGSLCIDADNWGFNSFYDATFQLQNLLLKSGRQIENNRFREVLKQQIAKLFLLADQIEAEFYHRLVIS